MGAVTGSGSSYGAGRAEPSAIWGEGSRRLEEIKSDGLIRAIYFQDGNIVQIRLSRVVRDLFRFVPGPTKSV